MKYEERAAFEQADAFGIGAPNDAYAQYFVGDSFLHLAPDLPLAQMSHEDPMPLPPLPLSARPF